MPLDMIGHIDDCFQSVPATRTANTGDYEADGIWQAGAGAQSSHKVTVQPVSEKEIESIETGGERIIDWRRIYVNDGDLYAITPADTWELSGIDGVFRCMKLDNRPWRNYCKIIVGRNDQS